MVQPHVWSIKTMLAGLNISWQHWDISLSFKKNCIAVAKSHTKYLRKVKLLGKIHRMILKSILLHLNTILMC